MLNSYFGSLKQLADKIYMKNALQARIAGVCSPNCIDCFRGFCIGKTFVGVERCSMLAFSNVWNLLNMNRSVASEFSVMLHGDGDVTSRLHSLHSTDLDLASTCSEATACRG